jgi:hypothetical protein
MAEERSIFQKIGDAVADYAPALAGILTITGVGIPAAGAVAAVGTLARTFGLGSNAKPEDVLAAISADPEIRLKAMVANNDFVLKQRDQDIEELKIYFKDTEGARNLQGEALRQTDVFAKRFIYYYSGSLTFTTMLYIFLVTFSTVPKENMRLADTILGFLLGSVLATILQFFFGTNVGSLAKNKLLEVKDQMIGKLRSAADDK